MTSDVGLAPGIALAILLAALGSVALFATRANRSDLRFQLKLFVAAFAVRFAASLVLYQFGLASVVGDDDGQGWSQGAVLADQWSHQNLGPLDVPLAMSEAFGRQNRGYHYLLGGFFY